MPKKSSPKARRKQIDAFLKPFRVTEGKGFRLSRMNPAATRKDQWGVLLVFQAMDAAGKDGAIKHVMSGIRAFERYMARQGYLILKSFLNVSKKAQKQRFLERLELPEKNWKFSLADANERGHWNAYMKAYQELIRATAAPHAPWYIVPADKKWFSRLVVAAAIHDALERLGLAYPKVDEAKKKDLAAARAALEGGEEGSDK